MKWIFMVGILSIILPFSIATTFAQVQKNENLVYQTDYLHPIDEEECTELGLACKEGNLEKVKTLLAQGADIENVMSDGMLEYSAMYIAIESGKAEVVACLIGLDKNLEQMQDDCGNTYLSLACGLEDKNTAFRIAKMLLDAGADVNVAKDVDKDFISIPLHQALGRGNLSLADFLIKNGANLYASDRNNETLYDMLGWHHMEDSTLTYIETLLRADLTHKRLASTRYAGVYSFGKDTETRNGKVYIYPKSDTHVLFYVYLNIGKPAYNMGMLAGELEIENETGVFRSNLGYGENPCVLEFRFETDALKVSEPEDACDCGFGNGVYLNDVFTEETKEIPLYYTNATDDLVPFYQPEEKPADETEVSSDSSAHSSNNEMDVVEEYTYAQKSMAQVHGFLREIHPHLQAEMPRNNTEYQSTCKDEEVNVIYRFKGKTHLQITLEYPGGETTLEFTAHPDKTDLKIIYSAD